MLVSLSIKSEQDIYLVLFVSATYGSGRFMLRRSSLAAGTKLHPARTGNTSTEREIYT